jgi:hypothetical protein
MSKRIDSNFRNKYLKYIYILVPHLYVPRIIDQSNKDDDPHHDQSNFLSATTMGLVVLEAAPGIPKGTWIGVCSNPST